MNTFNEFKQCEVFHWHYINVHLNCSQMMIKV